MLLKEIRIRNFRPFRDISIDFANGDKNITIFKGNVGTGRTALKNAISWCLYGYDFQDKYETLPLYNIKAAYLASYGDEIEVSVELIFDDEGEIFSIKRIQSYMKEIKELIKSDYHFEVRKQRENDIIISHEDQYAINSKIPRGIFEYYSLNDLNKKFNRYDNERIFDLVLNFSQLDILKSINHHLKLVKKFYVYKIKELNEDIYKKYEEKNFLEDKIHKIENKKRECLKEKEIIHNRIDSIKKELESADSNISKLLQRRIDLQDSIKTKSFELEQLEKKLNKHVLTKYPHVLFYDILKDFDLGEKYSDKTLNFNELKENISKDVIGFKDISIDLHKKIKRIEEERENNINELDTIEHMLDSVDKEEVKFLLEDYNHYIELIQNANMEILYFSNEINYLKERLKAKDEKIILSAKNIKFEEYNKKIEFCEKSLSVSEGIFTQLNEELIRNIQEKMNEIISKNYFKNHAFEIIFNENREFIIKNKQGILMNFDHLSYAEQSLIELSFIATLNKIEGINLPIFIDSLNCFDMDAKMHMAELLLDLSQDNQIILLLSRAEDGFLDTLLEASKIYCIYYEHSEEGPESKVVLDD